MPRLYAEGTAVPAERSQAEIQQLLRREGAGDLGFLEHGAGVAFIWKMRARSYRLDVVFPASLGPTRQRSAEDRRQAEIRRRLRSAVLILKAKFEAVRSGVVTFEREFLSLTVIPDGSGATVADRVEATIESYYQDPKATTSMPLLPPRMLQLGPGSKQVAGGWAVLVIQKDGSQEYVRNTGGPIATFSKRAAHEFSDNLSIGIGDEVQSINVVRAPRPKPLQMADLDRENGQQLERLIAAFRADIAALLASGRSGEIHAVADVREGRLTHNSHITPARQYPLKSKG